MLLAVAHRGGQIDCRMPACIQRGICNNADPSDHFTQNWIAHLRRREVLQLRRLPDECVRHAVRGAELRIDSRIGAELKGARCAALARVRFWRAGW